MTRAAIAFMIATACAGEARPTDTAPPASRDTPEARRMPEPTTTFADHLSADAFGPMFVWPQHDLTVAAIWDQPGNPGALEGVLRDPGAPIRGQIIAAEVLFRRDFSFIDRIDHGELAAIYARALPDRAVGAANLWGLLWEGNDAGVLGGRVIILGREAIAAWRPLLEDEHVVDWYEGSEDATVGNGARYRVKDFAAFYLARIVGHRIPFHAQTADRDAAIDELRAKLP